MATSPGVGLFPGGAQWAIAVTITRLRTRPSPIEADVAWLASPALCSDRYSQSPLLSPVNIRPVRFAPCAAGASPTISPVASGSPKFGTGLPQYSSPLNAARFSRATRVHQSRNLGHDSQPTIRLFTDSNVGTKALYQNARPPEGRRDCFESSPSTSAFPRRTMSAMSDSADRISSLENEIAVLKRQGLRTTALFLVAATVPFIIAGTGSQQVVKADRFEVTKDGVVVAEIGSDDDGGRIRVFSNEGKIVGEFMVSSGGQGQLSLFNSDQDAVATLAVTDDSGHGSLQLNNKEKHRIVWLSGMTNGAGSISAYGNGGGQTVRIASTTDGDGSIEVMNRDGGTATHLGASTGRHGFLKINNSSGKEVAWLGGNSIGGGNIKVNNASGVEVAFLVSDDTSRGQLSLRDADGTERTMMAADGNGGWMSLRAPGGTVRWVAP